MVRQGEGRSVFVWSNLGGGVHSSPGILKFWCSMEISVFLSIFHIFKAASFTLTSRGLVVLCVYSGTVGLFFLFKAQQTLMAYPTSLHLHECLLLTVWKSC